MQFEAQLPPSPASVSEARARVADTMRRWRLDVDRDALLLALSEVVTNAIRHGRGRLQVTLRWENHAVEIGVTDHRPRAGPRLVHKELDEEGGRGMHIVDAIATDWGVRRDGDVKTVWFRLPTTTSPPTEVASDGGSPL